MMSRIRVFDHISVKIPFTAIQRRMGFNRKHNLSGTGDISGVRGIIENANDLIRVKGAAVRLGIEVKEDSVRFENGYIMKSRMTAGLLKECSEALVMGVTGGASIVDEIERLSAEGEMRRAVIFDASASEIVDAAFDWIIDYYRREVVRGGGKITDHRFSAGYGDLDLLEQVFFYNILELGELGVDITENHILIPEKSVTAIAGLEFGGR